MIKYVRIFCDYSADPFWYKEGGMMGYEKLPISPALKLAFYAWDQHFQFNNTYLNYHSGKFGKGGLASFSRLGEMLAKQVKEELPDWTVVYLNKYKQKEYHNKRNDPSGISATSIYDRSSWEYEITETNNNLEHQFNKGV